MNAIRGVERKVVAEAGRLCVYSTAQLRVMLQGRLSLITRKAIRRVLRVRGAPETAPRWRPLADAARNN